MDHLTFGQQVVMALIHGGVPSAFISVFGAWILVRQRRCAEAHKEATDRLHDCLHNGLREIREIQSGGKTE